MFAKFSKLITCTVIFGLVFTNVLALLANPGVLPCDNSCRVTYYVHSVFTNTQCEYEHKVCEFCVGNNAICKPKTDDPAANTVCVVPTNGVNTNEYRFMEGSNLCPIPVTSSLDWVEATHGPAVGEWMTCNKTVCVLNTDTPPLGGN